LTRQALFRVDGSQRLGTGHVVRCLTLAATLSERGIGSVFVMADGAPEIARYVAEQGYPVSPLPADSSAETDAALTLAAAAESGAQLIITDLSNSRWLARRVEYRRLFSGLSDGGRYLAAFDDPSTTDFTCDLKIIPYLDVTPDLAANRQAAKLLAGPEYFVMRGEFSQPPVGGRVVRDPADNVLVTMGGSDPKSLTAKVLRALLPLELELSVVTGVAFNAALLAEIRELLGGRGELIHQAWNMAALMRRADLVVSAGGLTKYEAAATGTPLVLLSQNEFEAGMSEAFARHGMAHNLGLGSEVEVTAIATAVRDLLGDAPRRREMSARGSGLIDGRGAERVIEVILSEAWE
jgi:UDP-2,4-diacetamido-2,4,6-trideoxy-beta-L-altropyranose hydrolase